MSFKKIVFAGGGTGGHVFPILALADALSEMASDVQLRFIGSAHGLESKLIPERGWNFETIPSAPLKGRSLREVTKGVAISCAAMMHAARWIRKNKPDLVVSIGGYSAGPFALAASLMGVDVVLLEPNCIAGLTQRWLSHFAKQVYVGFEETRAQLGAKSRVLGVPLRKGFRPVPIRIRKENEPLRLLIMGGSQGAMFLNQRMPEVLHRLLQMRRLSVVHQTGRGNFETVHAAYQNLSSPHLQIEVHEFLEDVPTQIANADWVVARSGALTCAELCAIGRASLLIPYPYAADNHQLANAKALEKAGTAVCMEQRDATADAIGNRLIEVFQDETLRSSMSKAAQKFGRPNATYEIASELLHR